VKIIVQKFGGTSVITPELRQQVADRIIATKQNGYGVVAVVSAMGRQGDPYSTDTLLRLMREAGGEPVPNLTDLLLSCGEVIAAAIVAQTIAGLGISAAVMTGGQAGIITDSNFGAAEVIEVKPAAIRRCLENDSVVIVAGFQGMTPAGEVTTLGRGGSDTTAAVLGVALGAEAIEFYKDVEGIMTADPKFVPDARVIGAVTYNELFQLAYQGAKVIHPRAVEIAMENNLPLRVKGTASDAPGTLVARNGKDRVSFTVDTRTVTGVTYLPNVTQVRVETPPGPESGDLAVRLFQELAAASVSIDLINVFPERKFFTVAGSDTAKAVAILRGMGLAVGTGEDCAKVSIVGAGMRGVPGVMATFVAALHDAGVKILQTADSHVTISGLVQQADLGKSLQALHAKFGLADEV